MFLAKTIFFQLAALLLMTLTGWLMTRKGVIRDEKALNGMLTHAALPSLIIAGLQVPYSATLLKDMGITLGGMALIFFISFLVGALVAYILKKRGIERGAWIACTMFPNAVFMGQPLITALYGEEALSLIAPIALLFNLTSFTIGVWLVGGGSSGMPFQKSMFLKPAVLSCFVGIILFFMPFRLPGFVLSPLKMLAATTTPISMVINGCQLAKVRFKDLLMDVEVYIISFCRLVLAGVSSFFVLRFVIQDPAILGILTVCACMPCAAILPVIASDQKGDAVLCSKTVFVSTLLCVVTAPLLIQFLLGSTTTLL